MPCEFEQLTITTNCIISGWDMYFIIIPNIDILSCMLNMRSINILSVLVLKCTEKNTQCNFCLSKKWPILCYIKTSHSA